MSEDEPQQEGEAEAPDAGADDEQAGDEQAGDEQAGDAPGDDGAEGSRPESATDTKDGGEDDRIAEITERIDKARSQAEEAGVLVDADEEHYSDSGVTETDDDQTITPPG